MNRGIGDKGVIHHGSTLDYFGWSKKQSFGTLPFNLGNPIFAGRLGETAGTVRARVSQRTLLVHEVLAFCRAGWPSPDGAMEPNHRI